MIYKYFNHKKTSHFLTFIHTFTHCSQTEPGRDQGGKYFRDKRKIIKTHVFNGKGRGGGGRERKREKKKNNCDFIAKSMDDP